MNVATALDDPALRQLQRLDGEVSQVVAKARHVAVYSLKLDSSGREIWEREKLEGSLFLVRRRIEPYYALCVLNRLTTTDLVQPLKFGTNDFELEFPPSSRNFIIFRTQGNIRAIWFAQEEEEGGRGYEDVRAAIEMVEREVLSTPPIPKHVSRPSNADGDGELLSMTEMRDALFRLLSNDKFMLTLHAQYVQAEQRRRQQQAPPPSAGPGPMGPPQHPHHQMMHPPHSHFLHMQQQQQHQQQLVPPPSPLDQSQQQQYMARTQQQQQPQPGFAPPYQLPPWNGPPPQQGPYPMPPRGPPLPLQQPQQPGGRPAMYPAPYPQKQ